MNKDRSEISGLVKTISNSPRSGHQEISYSAFKNPSVITYLSSWTVTGQILSDNGTAHTFSLLLKDEQNLISLKIGKLQWRLTFPSNQFEVFNDITNGKLSITINRAIFSESDPIWYLERDSQIHVSYEKING